MPVRTEFTTNVPDRITTMKLTREIAALNLTGFTGCGRQSRTISGAVVRNATPRIHVKTANELTDSEKARVQTVIEAHTPDSL